MDINPGPVAPVPAGTNHIKINQPAKDVSPTINGNAPETTQIKETEPHHEITSPSQIYVLDNAQPLAVESFPNPPRSGYGGPPPTIPNVQHLLAEYGITVRYDVIKKKLHIGIPSHSGTSENADNVALILIQSLAILNGMMTGPIAGILEALGDRNQYNAVADWITSKPWDGQDRLKEFYNTLVIRDDYPSELRDRLMYRWLLSGVAAALEDSGFSCRGVLTLQGPQSIGKTSWIRSLIPNDILRDSVLRLDHHLDAHNKDSMLTAVCHWIVEIGELDSSLKKDIARLKGFITCDRDKLRRPYAKTDSEYQRRTVFCATVNDDAFLVDSTGNTRFWTIPVKAVNFKHGIDMQQLFAQVAAAYEAGHQWWLTRAEEEALEDHNKLHRASSVIRELILEAVDLDYRSGPKLGPYTAMGVLSAIGIKQPTNPQCKECNAVLKELFGEPKRSKGQNRWWLAFKGDMLSFFQSTTDDD